MLADQARAFADQWIRSWNARDLDIRLSRNLALRFELVGVYAGVDTS